MANNAIPDSTIMNMMCRSLIPPAKLELNEPNVRSIEVALTSKNTLRILNTIKPVIRVFTAMDAAKAVRAVVTPQGSVINRPWSNNIAAFVTSQVTSNRGAINWFIKKRKIVYYS